MYTFVACGLSVIIICFVYALLLEKNRAAAREDSCAAVVPGKQLHFTVGHI